jgi:hypothetical protein
LGLGTRDAHFVEEHPVRPEDLQEFVWRRPFQPFRLTLTDGRTYEVRHPEMAMVGRSSVVIGLPAPGDASPIFDRAVHVALLHIMQLELLEPVLVPSPSQN